MHQKASTNGTGFKQPPMAKGEIISSVLRIIGEQPETCSILDLDNPAVLSQPITQAVVAVWLDSWSDLVAMLGTSEDAQVGVLKARAYLGLVADHVDYLLFSADATKPPLDQYSKGIKMLFEASTGLHTKEVATYKGRVVYLGSKKINL